MNIFILNETSTIDWLEALNAAITTIMSVAIAIFTLQQVRIAKMKRKDDLYDARYKVYEKYREFAKCVIHERGNIRKQKDLIKEAMFHEFLFNDDVTNFMNQTWEKYYDIENPFLSGDASIDQDTVIFNNENTKKSYVAAYAYFMDHFLRELRDKFETYLKLEK